MINGTGISYVHPVPSHLLSISICDVKHVLSIVEFWSISNIYICELWVANAKKQWEKSIYPIKKRRE